VRVAPDPGPTALPWRGFLLLLLCLAAVGLRVVALGEFEAAHPLAEHLAIDERSYDEWGARIAADDWLGDEVFFQEPLYPYFLGVVYAVFGHELSVLRLVQCLLGGITTLLIFHLGRRTLGEGAGWIAALGFCLFPPAVLLPCLVLKANLFLPLFAALALLVIERPARVRHWLLAGVLGGLGALLRGNLLILLPVLCLWPLARSRFARATLRYSAAFGAGAALVLVPVLLRNVHVGGVWSLTTSGAGTNFYGGNNADNPYGVATEFDWVRGIPRYEAQDWRREAERRLDRELDAGETSSYWLGEALDSMATDPGLHLSIFWNKLRLAVGTYEVPDNHHLEWDARYVPVLAWGLPGFGLWGGLGLAGIALLAARRRLRGEALELGVLFLFYLGTIVLTVVSMRARLPLVVPLFPFAGYWVWELGRAYVGHTRELALRRVAGVLLLGILGVGLSSFPVFSSEQRAEDMADRDYNLAVSLLEREVELEEAARLAEQLVERYPRSARLQTLLADTEWRRSLKEIAAGRQEAAEALLDGALERLRRVSTSEGVNPREQSRAFRLAGYVQAGLGNWQAAERFFGRAREFAGEDLELRLSHGQALMLSAEALAPGPERDDRRARGLALLEGLVAEAPDSVEGNGASRILSVLD
jgi:4-amino-4-deoxy-L-arabinose transferase-like glycosyltransferase